MFTLIATGASFIFKGFQSSLQADNAATAQKRLEIMERTGDALATSKANRELIGAYVPQWTTATSSVSPSTMVLAAVGILIAVIVVIVAIMRKN